MNSEEFPEDEIDDLVSQLKDNNKAFQKQKTEKKEITAENLEEFIMQSSGSLVQDSLEVIGSLKEYTNMAPDARETESIAELIKASTSAIETLNKILLQQKKSETQLKVKQMDVESRQGLAIAEQQTKILLSREDIMKKLMEDADTIDVTDQDEDTLSK
ncbi:hypothetical protein OAU81_00040 [bacterium]|nr:hypothetical protein [bacterium]